jgi:LCP family protein required for cell wall assembly
MCCCLERSNGIVPDLRKNHQEASMSKKRLVIVVLSICAIIGLVFGVSRFNSLMEKPLGPSLRGNPSEQPISNSDQLQTPGQLSTLVQLPTREQANQPRPLCGRTPVLTMLAIGIDYRGDNYLYGLADVIRIVRIDFTIHKVSVLTLDRAIWVEIPGISDHYGITHGMLNQSYFYGVPAMGYYDGPGGGAGLLAATLKMNFDLNVDNYIVVDFRAFVKIVDALGGIDVNLPEPVDGNLNGESLGYFSAGTQHLSGTQALNLARIREGYSTLIRDSNQDKIIKAIYDKVTSPEIIPKIPKLLQALKGAGLTDLSPNQIENMICLIQKMDRTTDLSMRGIPDKYYVYSWIYSQDLHQDINIWDIDFDVFRYYISEFMNGQWPQE